MSKVRSQTWRRRGAAIAVASALVVSLAACTAEPPGGNGNGASGMTTVTVAESGELCGLNNLSNVCSLQVNEQVGSFVGGYFVRVDNKGELFYDESFGTVDVLSEDPLVIKYTVNDGVVWSDGQQIGAADMILSTMARTGFYDDLNADKSAGTAYFGSKGNKDGARLAGFPLVGDDGRSMTIEYETPYADWAIFNPIHVPAHILAKKTGVVATDAESFIEFLRNIPQGDPGAPATSNADLVKMADFWTNAFQVSSLPDDPEMYLSAGPYTIQSWDVGQSVTLVRSETYTGDLVPHFDRVVIRFILDSTAQVQALKNGEVDIIVPQPSADTLSALEQISGVTVKTGASANWDVLQLNFRSSVFDDPDVREAFLKTIPREVLMDAIIRPMAPDAPMLNSLTLLPGQAGYDEVIKTNGSDKFGAVDIEGAKALLAGRTPTIRLGYNEANPNRLDSFLAIQASASQAGFKIVDGGLASDQWVAGLFQPETWDAFMWGQFVNGGTIGIDPAYWLSTGEYALGGWVNKESDAALKELVKTPDTALQVEFLKTVDELAWADYWGIPLYNLVGVSAHGPRVTGLEYNPWPPKDVWNFWEWKPVS